MHCLCGRQARGSLRLSLRESGQCHAYRLAVLGAWCGRALCSVLLSVPFLPAALLHVSIVAGVEEPQRKGLVSLKCSTRFPTLPSSVSLPGSRLTLTPERSTRSLARWVHSTDGSLGSSSAHSHRAYLFPRPGQLVSGFLAPAL